MLCEFCDELCISDLIELAKVEFSGLNFPQKAFYQHHASYADLVNSAERGCELCELIHQGFIETVVDGGYWDENSLDEAARRRESEGLSTDLKLCINTSHLYNSDPLERVKLFDRLLVHAGDFKTYEPGEEWSILDSLEDLHLDISVPRGKSRYVGNFEVGRYDTDPDLGSAQNHEIARSWLETCCAQTRTGKVSKLPTRVIDVGDPNGSQNPKLFVSDMTRDKYAALSHCWGGVISPLLTTENIKAFQEYIPYNDLPANFQDAIVITRHLGIRYLWIDSLCIIQNSKLDWEIESKKMGFIYRYALLTVSASTSPGSTHGILRYSPTSNEIQQRIALKVYKDNDLDDSVNISRQIMPEELHKLEGSTKSTKAQKKSENLYDLFYGCVLSQRGWTLQEGLLSPRILYYGQRQIYWKCSHGFHSADGMPSVDGGYIMPSETVTFPTISSALLLDSSIQSDHGAPPMEKILEDYYWLVQAYSARRLTFESDKLPAFSGIVELLHSTIGGDYLAGIWSRDLARGLSWYKDGKECKHVKSYRSPSWSWAVTDDEILYFPFDGQTSFSDLHEVEMVSCDTKSKTESPYGQIESCRLLLKGWTKRLIRSSQEIEISTEPVAPVYYDEEDHKLSERNGPNLFDANTNNEKCLMQVPHNNMTDFGTSTDAV